VTTGVAAAAVRIEGVSQSFERSGPPVLDGVDLTVAQGEFVCLLGASGCGKSTLLNLMAGLNEPTAGRVEVAAERPALMFQEPALLPWLTAAGNVELALKARGMGRAERRDEALRLLDVKDTYRTVDTAGPWWDVDFAIGACQLVRREVFEAAGGFDEEYFYGPEDVDFCLRLREGGLRIVQVADAGCHHPPRRRNRAVFTRRGMRHATAVARHLWRHRGFSRRVAA